MGNVAAIADQAVLVQRGTCNFTEKAENVQRVGARFMLLAETEQTSGAHLDHYCPVIMVTQQALLT